MHRLLAAERGARDLAAAVGDHLVDVHVELGAAAGHPDVQRKHRVVLAGEDLVARLHDQPAALVVEPGDPAVGDRAGLLQHRVGGDHLGRHALAPDAEMLDRALRLRAPQLVGRDLDHAQAVGLASGAGHCWLLKWLHGHYPFSGDGPRPIQGSGGVSVAPRGASLDNNVARWFLAPVRVHASRNACVGAGTCGARTPSNQSAVAGNAARRSKDERWKETPWFERRSATSSISITRSPWAAWARR